ncbi:MAG: S8 family serine peptidase [bacterium]|nr:S8 family serine peptidase [bacterium]
MKACISFFFYFFLLSSNFVAQTIYPNYLDGRLYVKVDNALLKELLRENPRNIPISKIKGISALAANYGITKVCRPFSQADDDAVLPRILKLEFNKIGGVNALMDDLQKIAGVAYAEKVPLMKTDATTPNDFAITSASIHLTQINAQNAWDIFNGNSNITVAIVDVAVMWTHADLIQNTYTNTAEIPANTIDDDGNGYVDDVNGFDVTDWDGNANPTNPSMLHGTHVAGIAAGRTNNGIGVASIGWNLKLIPVKCQTDNGSTSIVANGFEGILYAVKAKARIISCSWGNSSSSLTEQSVIDYAWNRGCIVIASAGNNSNSAPNYPGAYTNVYCVAAVDPLDGKNTLSSFGTWVDIAAPGDNIMSTIPYTGTVAAYQPFSGTSMATPMVAGLAGLMLSKSPNMTRNNVLNCISTTAVNIYTLLANSGYVTGNQLGAGRIEAYQAMVCASTFSALPPVANFYSFPKNTCPNTIVSFNDSSLYVPTTWNWVFQGGSPATSTLMNPGVQWTTPGTYSVSLAVSNANGSNAITKLSYVTVAGPIGLPFTEGFQSVAFLPPNWTPNNIQNDNIYWTRNTGVGGFGTSTACAMFDNYVLNAPGERDEMRSPKFDFSNVAVARLRFDVAYARYDAYFSDSLEVKLSTNCGSTWTSIYLKGGTVLATAPDASSQFVPSATQWRRDTINISSLTAGQGNVMFSFINRGHYGQPIYLDNINLVFPSPSVSINQPTSVCVGPTNYSFATISGASSFTWNFPGGSPGTSSLVAPIVSYTSPGTYSYTISGINGTSSTSVTQSLLVFSYPTLVVSTSTICSGNTATVSASGANSYLWFNGTVAIGTASSVVVSPTITTFYTVTGKNGTCATPGTTSVTVTSSTVVVTVTSNPALVCSGASSTLSAVGATTYSWSTGANTSSIVVTPASTSTYSVNGLTNGCGANTVATVSVVPLPQTALMTANALCANVCNGSVSVVNTIGVGPFTYSMSSGNCTVLPCSNLCAGAYTLITTGSANCKSSQTFTLSQPQVLQTVITSSSNATCPSCADGQIVVSVNGGTSPYTYSWSPGGSVTATLSGIPAGCYTLNITDQNGCTTATKICIDSFTGIQTLTGASGLVVYPNPAKNEVSVDMKEQTFELRLYDYLGQVLFEKQVITGSCKLDLSPFAKGVYLIEVEVATSKTYRKLILE